MDRLQETLAQFGRQIGIADLGLSREGVLQLAIGPDGLLGLEALTGADGPQVLVYVERSVRYAPAPVARRALQLADLTRSGTHAVQPCLRQTDEGPRLLALMRIPERGFSVQALNRTVDCLQQWLDDALAAGDDRA